jgi:hypothetical protein
MVKGRLLEVVDGRVIGWVWDPEAPEDRVEVEVEIDGDPVASGVADLDHPDLAEGREGMSDGRHGFRLELPERLATGGPYSVRVVAGPDQVRLKARRSFKADSSGNEAWNGTEFVPIDKAEGKDEADEPIQFEDDAPDPGGSTVVGKRGWLFHSSDEDRTIEQLRGEQTLTDDDLETAREALLAREDALKQIGIPYLFAVAPLKERVYPRRLPKDASLHPKPPVQRLNAIIRDARGAEAFDLLPPLLDARAHGELYHRTDTNWNHRGAFFAYRALVKEAGKRVVGLEPIGVEDAPFVKVEAFAGDLADKPKLTLSGDELVPFEREMTWEEEVEEVDASKLRSKRMPAPSHLDIPGARVPRVYEVSGAEQLPRAVLLGDSACLNLIPWLGEHFRRLVFLWALQPPVEAIELEMPDIVLQVLSERALAGEGPPPPETAPVPETTSAPETTTTAAD